MAIEKAKQDSIVKALHVRVMDFKTNNASNLEACFLQLAQMFDNVLHNPDNAKFKQVMHS